MKHTSTNKRTGEMVVRQMSEKAQRFYSETEPFYVYEYEERGRRLYAYAGALGDKSGLTFDEMQQELEELFDATVIDDMEEEDGE